ncbi:MAG TPA: arginine--tRNA ligase, partial [Fimbriimonadaceae bacterium]|nr:arginine--tRNA ligase [Fimbriimonadaceae bacterium]
PTPTLSDAKDASHGDFSSQFALAASKTAGLPPREIADRLAAQLPLGELLDSAEVAGPGFLNLRLKPAAIAKFVKEVLEKGDDLPRSVAEAPVRLNVELVSVNPHGPIIVGAGRGAAFGSTLCNVLEAAGHQVHREYYINDGTNSEQMRLFAESAFYFWGVRYGWNVSFPTAGYRGDYVEKAASDAERAYGAWRRSLNARIWILDKFIDEAEEELLSFESVQFASQHGSAHVDECKNAVRAELHELRANRNELDDQRTLLMGARQAAKSVLELLRSANHWPTIEVYMKVLMDRMIATQRDDLSAFATTFDTWFSEQSLHDSGKVEECIDALIAKGAADTEPYQLEVIKKKGEPDEVKRNEQPVEEEDADQANESFEPSPPTPSPSSPGREKGEGAHATLWLRSTKFGDDKDRVLRRKDGRWTYIASDVAYHKDKFIRGSAPGEKGSLAPADKLLTILGPDHHGYIGRLRAVVAALLEEQGEAAGGEATQPLSESEALLYRDPAERDACLAALEEARKKLEVVIFQIVRFVKDGKPAPMRKRDGNIYSLKDLMLEIGKNAAPAAEESEQLRIGKDVARFFYLMRSHDTHMDFDLDLAEKQSDENPDYYVQYAHARICSVLRKAEETGLGAPGPHDPFDSALLAEPKELALIKKVCDLPFEVRRCAEDYGVHRLTSYATELARAYHAFYDSCRVLQPENLPLTRARLALCQAAAIGLRSTLGLLGISAPERM